MHLTELEPRTFAEMLVSIRPRTPYFDGAEMWVRRPSLSRPRPSSLVGSDLLVCRRKATLRDPRA
jgi:hypothetical protein